VKDERRAGAAPRALPSRREILTVPLPDLPRRDRPLQRVVVSLLRGLFIEAHGVERVAVEHDPFIIALNHNQRPEAVAIPTMLYMFRGGRIIHFIADWNSMLIPGVGYVMRRGKVIVLVRKDARPRFLNLLKPLYQHPDPVFVRARRLLDAGRSVGIFPEGTVNRDPGRLLPGHPGAARLSLQSGRPLIPAGLRFPGHPPDQPIRDLSRFVLEIGEPLVPPPTERPGRPSPEEVRAWHDRLMRELSRLSGKAWEPRSGGSRA
jgi:1-acyl-sn-glycerol-3-phosphate acyltransferase